jgi:hypothetical protein
MKKKRHHAETDSDRSSDSDVEQLLAAAGFDFTVVSRCPDPACPICAARDLSAAA